jgi:hypothetical protein
MKDEEPLEVITNESTQKSPVQKRGFKEYPDRGSNPDIRRYKILSLARLPIPPSGLIPRMRFDGGDLSECKLWIGNLINSIAIGS